MFSGIRAKVFSGLTGAGIVGGGVLKGRQFVKERFGPTAGKTYEKGQKIIHNGEEYQVLGWTGHSKDTFDRYDMTDRDLYCGDKEAAQGYGIVNGRSTAEVAVVVAKEEPAYGMQRFEGEHAPYTSKSMKDCETKIIHREPVNSETDCRTSACCRRALEHFRKNWKDGHPLLDPTRLKT